MGALPSKPLYRVTTEELATAVSNKGPKFGAYADAIRENAVNGALLDSLNQEEFLETLQDLDITNRLHKRVLTKEWEEAKKKEFSISVEERAFQDDTGDGNDWRDKCREMAKAHPEYVVTGQYPEPVEDVHRALVLAAAEYDLTPVTPARELTVFDDIAAKAMKECKALYSGIHLIDNDGHTSISSRFYMDGQVEGCEPQTERLHVTQELSSCYHSVVTQKVDFVHKNYPPGGTPFQIKTKIARYVGCILKSDNGQRIGIICIIKQDDGDDKEEILRELAREAENQLRLRKVLLERARTLQRQVTDMKSQQHHEDEIVLPAYGPINAVTKSQLRNRPSVYPSPEEIAATGKPCRCATLPLFQENHATPEEMSHLSQNYWDGVDSQGIDRTPVPRDDRERVAVTESLGLQNVEPDSTLAQRFQNLSLVANRLFDVPLVILALHTHEKSVSIVGCGDPCGVDVLKTYEDGCTFLCDEPRAFAFCNYPIHTKSTFVIHDMLADESFSWSETVGYRFYSGVPLMYRGYAIASLCLLDCKARPDFTRANEIQQEQLGELMMQDIANWAVHREVAKLEEERKLLGSSTHVKTSPPEHHAALVFTDVQGSTQLWEANSDAMHEALRIHDTIMRQCCAEFHGYEVNTEGDAFHLAFHDAVDAVGFAIKVQEALYGAPWSDDILALPDACDDGRGFRGLRVRIAIHSGKVGYRDNNVTGRREYTGKTVYIAKSLEHMAHGGQILVSTDVWSVASYLTDRLDSPQVVDLGMHVLWTGKAQNEGLITKGVVQVVPRSLAYDYFAHRRITPCGNEAEEKLSDEHQFQKGRRFPPPKSRRRISAAFHDAPNVNNEVCIVFVNTSEVEAIYDDPSMIHACLSELIGSMVGSGPGYHCKTFMVAFQNPSQAAAFGLSLQERLATEPVDGEYLGGLLKVGFNHGEFTWMGPDQTSGRADYFGKVVNRAARVAAVAEPGEVYVGAVADDTPDLESGLDASFIGQRVLKGIEEEVALYSCSRGRWGP